MVVQNKWAVDEQDTNYPQASPKKEGSKVAAAISKVAILAADTDASVYGMVALPGGAIVKDIKLVCSEITAGTDYDIGLYRMDADGTIGAVIEKDTFLDGQTMAVAIARGAEITGISAISLADSDKTVAELAAAVSGLVEKDPRYCLALTANTVGSADGTIVVFTDFTNA